MDISAEILIILLGISNGVLYGLFWILMFRVNQLEAELKAKLETDREADLGYSRNQPVDFEKEETPAFLKRQAD